MITSGTIAKLGLKYGLLGFGGGYSVLAQIKRELVDDKKWLDGAESSSSPSSRRVFPERLRRA